MFPLTLTSEETASPRPGPGRRFRTFICQFRNEATCAFAAAGGHLEVLKWVRSKGCPWGEETCASAARGGRLEVSWFKGGTVNSSGSSWYSVEGRCGFQRKPRGHIYTRFRPGTNAQTGYNDDFACATRDLSISAPSPEAAPREHAIFITM